MSVAPKPSQSCHEAALWYADVGLRVVPVPTPTPASCSCNRDVCENPGKHPRIMDWPDKASKHPEDINGWWTLWPDSNLGIATGSASGVLVLDVDPRNGGDEALARLEHERGRLPPTWE